MPTSLLVLAAREVAWRGDNRVPFEMYAPNPQMWSLLSWAHLNVLRRHAGGLVVSTEAAPAALGPYSQAVKAGSTLYISGQIGFDPTTMEFAGESVEAQTTQVGHLCDRS